MEPPSLPKELSTSFIPQGDREGGCREGGDFLYFLLESKHVLLKKASWCGPHVTGLTLSFNNQTKRKKKKNSETFSTPQRVQQRRSTPSPARSPCRLLSLRRAGEMLGATFSSLYHLSPQSKEDIFSLHVTSHIFFWANNMLSENKHTHL